MRLTNLFFALLLLAGLTGCVSEHTTAPRDVTPPAAPRGLYTVTGDHSVALYWLGNTESDLAGYRIYSGDCASGADCPYVRIGTVTANSTAFDATGLANGVTKYFAIAAVDAAGNESALSYETIYDTPRPSGTGAVLGNFFTSVNGAGWDFSQYTPRSSSDPETDIYFGYNGSIHEMFAKDVNTDIQDAGYGASLDHVDVAPASGWSPTGTVELILGHCYVVWTRDNHFAKFRVTALSNTQVTFDWAYQTAQGNPELAARRAVEEGQWPAARKVYWAR